MSGSGPALAAEGARAGAPPAAPALGRTIVSIQSLRFFAAFAVVLFHAHLAISRGAPGHPATLTYLFGLGASGVHVFFCISGFVMVYTSYCRDAGPFAPGDFLLKRALRIYPIYWLCAGAYLAFHHATSSAYPLSPGETLGALALLPDDAPKIIGPAWTLAFEVYFYLCFCLFMMLGLVPGLLAMTGFFVVSVAAGVVLGDALPPLFTNSLLLEFVGGGWIGYLAIARPALLARVAWPAIAAGIVGFAGGLAIGYDRLPSFVMWGLPSAALLVGAIGLEAGQRLPRPLARFAVLGDGSYFLYLSHILIVDMLLLTPLALMRGSTAGVVAATLVAAAICAAVSVPAFERVERPMLRQLRRVFLR